MKKLFPGLLLSLCCIGYGAETVKASHLAQWVMPDGRVQISWITEKPQKAAKLIVTDRTGKTQIIAEKHDTVRNHAVAIPADAAKVVVSATEKTEDALFPALAITPAPTVKTKEFKIPLFVSDPAAPRRNYPVRSGVPFAKGVLGSADEVMLTDAYGKEIDASFEIFSKYPDGSVKWLTVSFNADTRAGKRLNLFLHKRKTPAKKRAAVNLNEWKKLLSNLRCEITFADGKVAVLQLTDSRIVAETTIPGGTRIAYWSKFGGNEKYFLQALCTVNQNGLISVDFRIIALRSQHVELVKSIVWRGFPKTGGADFVRRQLYVDEPRQEGFLQRKNLTLYVPHFWQQYPKGITVRNGELVYEVLPELPASGYLPEKLPEQHILCRYFWYRDGGLYAFRHHIALPGKFTLCAGQSAKLSKAHLENPLFAVSTPQYYCSTGVFGPVYPADGKTFPDAESCFAESFANHLKTRELNSDYGWMSWGDWYGERGNNWGNNEYDLAYLTIIQFARTGNLAYLKRGLEMARHYTSVDLCHAEKPGRTPELAFAHSIGHVGDIFDRTGELGKRTAKSRGSFFTHFDYIGGHDFMTGSFFAAALTGDRMMFDAICYDCTQQAIYMSVNIKIPIERAPGWYLINQTNAYLFTANPLYLNAAHLIVDAVIAKQNPETGCLDLPNANGECSCPDAKNHRGGKAFAMGVLMHGMRFYHEITGEERAARSIVRSADWLMKVIFDPVSGKFRYKTGCPKFKYGSRFWTITTEGIVYAGKLTHNRKYAEFVRDHLGSEIRVFKPGTPSKDFMMGWRLIPHTLYYLKEQGITELPKRKVSESPIGKPDVYHLPAAAFSAQAGGKVYVRADKDTLSGGKCFSNWNDAGHSVTWRFPALQAGRYRFGICCSTLRPNSRKLFVNSKAIDSFVIPSTGGLGEDKADWQALLLTDEAKKPVVVELDGNPVEVTLLNETGGALNLDFIWFQRIR